MFWWLFLWHHRRNLGKKAHSRDQSAAIFFLCPLWTRKLMLFCFDYPALLELLSYLTQALSIPVMNWGFCVTWLSELILVFTFNFFTQQRIVAIFFWKSVLYLPKTQWNSCICLGSSRAPSLILEPSVYQLFTA